MKKLIGVIFGLTLLAVPHKVWATWDIATPAGTEAKSLGDDRIREFKVDVATALDFQGDFPGEDTSSPRYINTPSSGTTANRPSGSTDTAPGMLYINFSSSTIEQYNGEKWTPVASLVPSGMKMIFASSSCPNGWILDTSFEGYALRTTITASSGTASAGSIDANAVRSHTHTTPNHQHLTEYSIGASAYTTNGPIISADVDGNAINVSAAGGASYREMTNRTQNSGGGTSGSETELAYKTKNVIICTAP